jgi:hypothetical protein
MKKRIIGVAGVGTVMLAGQVSAGPIVACFDTVRGGVCSISSGFGMTELRAAILAAFPATTFRPLGVLTGAGLQGADVVVLVVTRDGSSSAITPLTEAEQAALVGFVAAGGGAVVFVDNDSFAGLGTAAANQSLVSPFGVTVAGTGLQWPVTATVPTRRPHP